MHDRLRTLLTPLHDEARAFSRRLCRSTADGDDVFHDAVVRARQRIDTLRDDRAFRAWFYQIVVNLHRSRYRRGLWQRLVPLVGNEASSDFTPSEELEAQSGANRARQALAALPAVQREAIVLFELEGFAVEEIAAVQQASISAVKSRLSRGRQKLRTVYVKRFGMSPETGAELAKGSTP